MDSDGPEKRFFKDEIDRSKKHAKAIPICSDEN